MSLSRVRVHANVTTARDDRVLPGALNARIARRAVAAAAQQSVECKCNAMHTRACNGPTPTRRSRLSRRDTRGVAFLFPVFINACPPPFPPSLPPSLPPPRSATHATRIVSHSRRFGSNFADRSAKIASLVSSSRVTARTCAEICQDSSQVQHRSRF